MYLFRRLVKKSAKYNFSEHKSTYQEFTEHFLM